MLSFALMIVVLVGAIGAGALHGSALAQSSTVVDEKLDSALTARQIQDVANWPEVYSITLNQPLKYFMHESVSLIN